MLPECFNIARACPRCDGVGITVPSGKWAASYTPETCYVCKGTGGVFAPDLPALLREISGKRSGKILAKPRPGTSNRAWFLFSEIRFHAGWNVNLGGLFSGSMRVANDPYRDEIREFGEFVVTQGDPNRSRGLVRWHRAFYGEGAR